MRIVATQYTLKNRAFEIYTAGCVGEGGVHCSGCHNPELWDFDQGENFTKEYFKKIEEKVVTFDNLIDNIMIFGGEPLDNPVGEMVVFLKVLRTLGKKIWLFTRYEIDEIPSDVARYCDYIKTGKFDNTKLVEDNTQYGIQLASSNQNIYKIVVEIGE